MRRISTALRQLLSDTTRRALVSRGLYDDAQEEAIHWNHVTALAREMEQPVELVRFRYENALMHLKPNARVKTYLPIFISRRLKLPLPHSS